MIDEKYRTSDLWLTSYCIANGIKLDRLVADPGNPKHVLFELSSDDDDDIKGIADSFHTGGQVNAKVYKQTTLDLKGKIFKLLKEQEENRLADEDN
jgi:uncharacterized protein YdcH (DUF465 family)